MSWSCIQLGVIGFALLRYYAYGLHFSLPYLPVVPLFAIDARVWTLINGLAVVTQSPLLYETRILSG